MAVFFQQQRAWNGLTGLFLQPRLHRRDRDQVGFDNPARCRRFRERFRQIRREAFQARVGVVHVGFGQPDIRQPFCKRRGARVKPGGFFQGNQILNQRKLCG
ncbi:Uncharacterised protein [Enterobacter hormaechei]|nr:Uncharacterised protein [Enterobacter hormaechei]